MTKVEYSKQRSMSLASVRRRRWWWAASATIVCGMLWAVAHAQQADSGWAIGVPSPIATGSDTTDLHQQQVLHNVLEQTQQPLLQKPSPTSSPQSATNNVHGGLRFAVRPDGTVGWRPVSQTLSPVASESLPQLAAPQSSASNAAAQSDEDGEIDCSGHGGREKKPVRQSQAAPLIDAYGNAVGGESAKTPSQGTAEDTGEEIVLDAGEPAASASDAATQSAPTNNSAPAASAPAESGTHAASTTPDTNGQQTPAANLSAAEPIPPPPLTRQLVFLRSRVRAVLNGYYRKTLNNRDNDPWEVMHGMLAYGVYSRVRQGGQYGSPITSVGWLCYNKPCKGQTLLYVNPAGEVRAKYGVGLQGHLGQLLAMLAQCHVSADYPIHVGDREFTIHDLIEAEKKTCYPKSELTFKLIALQHYIDLNDKWVNDQGVDWDFPRLIREELDQPIRGAACGGTHRLTGLSLVVKKRIDRGEPLDGEYARADVFVKKYQQYAFRLQNRDGSLSTSWFRGAGDEDDINRRIKTTGHILEWLCYSLSDEQLREQRTIRAVSYLANLMYSNYDNDWEIGPRSHATHALLLYDERVFRPFDKENTVLSYRPAPQVARRSQPESSQR